MKLGLKLGLYLGSFVITGLGGVFYWSTTPSYALFDIAYLSKKLEPRIDLDLVSKNLTDAAISEVSSQAMSNMQSSQDGFSTLGTVIGVGLIQQMRPAIELKIKEGLSRAIQDADEKLSTGSHPSVKRIDHRGDEAIVTFIRDGKELEVVMEKRNGLWKFTKFSEKTAKDFLKGFQQKQPATTMDVPVPSIPDVSSTPPLRPPQVETSVPKSQPEPTSTSSASNNFNAEIFDPPSNCRANPGTNSLVQKVLQRGDVWVDRANPRTDSKGETWYKENFLGCWLHRSQIRFK